MYALLNNRLVTFLSNASTGTIDSRYGLQWPSNYSTVTSQPQSPGALQRQPAAACELGRLRGLSFTARGVEIPAHLLVCPDRLIVPFWAERRAC